MQRRTEQCAHVHRPINFPKIEIVSEFHRFRKSIYIIDVAMYDFRVVEAGEATQHSISLPKEMYLNTYARTKDVGCNAPSRPNHGLTFLVVTSKIRGNRLRGSKAEQR